MIRNEKSKGILFKCPQHNRRGEQRIISIAMKHETQTGRRSRIGGRALRENETSALGCQGLSLEPCVHVVPRV